MKFKWGVVDLDYFGVFNRRFVFFIVGREFFGEVLSLFERRELVLSMSFRFLGVFEIIWGVIFIFEMFLIVVCY